MGETYTDPINTPAKHTNGADALIEKTPVPLVQVNFGEDGAVQLGHGGDNPKAWRAQFNKVFGTEEWTFASNSLAQLIASLPKISNGAPHEASINASIAAVHSIAPEDELEAMLALQIVATHSAAMKMFDRAMMLEQPVEVVDVFLKHANKLLRAFAIQMDTLNKHRGKGQQKMVVEHINVNEGGQAVIGNIQGGTGDQKKKEDQPHALTYAPGIEMPSPDTIRQPVPVTGDEEREMSDARRRVNGGT